MSHKHLTVKGKKTCNCEAYGGLAHMSVVCLKFQLYNAPSKHC